MYVQIRQVFHPSSSSLRILTRLTALKHVMYDFDQTRHLYLRSSSMVDS